ncbi:unnamed protein product, partial [Rotaria socialis]
PGCVLVLSTICLYFYSIDDERAKEIQIQLKTLRDTSSPEKGLVNDSNKMDNESADVYL